MVQSRRSPRQRRPLIAASCGSRTKSIAQLMKEQRIPENPPDYVALFSAVWPTKEEGRR